MKHWPLSAGVVDLSKCVHPRDKNVIIARESFSFDGKGNNSAWNPGEYEQFRSNRKGQSVTI